MIQTIQGYARLHFYLVMKVSTLTNLDGIIIFGDTSYWLDAIFFSLLTAFCQSGSVDCESIFLIFVLITADATSSCLLSTINHFSIDVSVLVFVLYFIFLLLTIFCIFELVVGYTAEDIPSPSFNGFSAQLTCPQVLAFFANTHRSHSKGACM